MPKSRGTLGYARKLRKKGGYPAEQMPFRKALSADGSAQPAQPFAKKRREFVIFPVLRKKGKEKT